jgi:hypothetical protein
LLSPAEAQEIPVLSPISVDDRHVELAEPRRIADDLDLGDLAVRNREGECSGLDASGLPVSGLSNVEGFDETPYDFNGTNIIVGNPNGVDTEGIVRTRNGHFWLADEYSPSLIHVNKDGRIIERFVPEDSLLGTTLATTPNYVVKKYLPKILNYRRQNRGFEGIAITPNERTIFIAMQSPLDYPTSTLGRASRNVRILRFDIGSERVTGDFVYHFDEVCAFLGEPAGCSVVPGEMKISGLVALSATSLLVEERTDTAAKSIESTCPPPRTFWALPGTWQPPRRALPRRRWKPWRIRQARVSLLHLRRSSSIWQRCPVSRTRLKVSRSCVPMSSRSSTTMTSDW